MAEVGMDGGDTKLLCARFPPMEREYDKNTILEWYLW
jgi:hypothetical protein